MKIINKKFLLCVLLLSIAPAIIHFTSAISADNNDWKPFTMHYETVGVRNKAPSEVVMYELRYDSKKSWRLDVLSHSVAPHFAGSYIEFSLDEEKGEMTEKFKNHLNNKEEYTKKQGKSYRLINPTLDPERISRLIRNRPEFILDLTPAEKAQFNVIASGLPLKKIVVTELRECFDSDNVTAEYFGAPLCKTQRSTTEQIIYVDKEFIPINIISFIDGYKFSEIAAKSIEIKKK
ncbi:MAG: hypothetical protein KIH69_012730 [Anaerolineae bacterium]|nr:hypothetical protein [Anaerolineae bacterium]